MRVLLPAPHQPNNRSGVTLVEVLMSLMIMSIGVAMVASLFPISVLRSAQATKLTNAAILKYNVELLVELQPELIFDPDGDYSTATTDAERRDRIAEHYNKPNALNYIVDPNGYMAHAEEAFPQNVIVSDAASNASPDKFCSWMGNTAGFPFTGNAAGRGLRRYDGGLQTTYANDEDYFIDPTASVTTEDLRAMRLSAAAVTGLGDGWDTVVDETADVVALTAGGDGVTFAAVVDLSAVVASADFVPDNGSGPLIADPEIYRITLFSETEGISQSYPLTRMSGNICYWTEAAVDLDKDGVLNTDRPLPAEFGGAIGRVLIQVKRTNDFNWMLTVRRGSDGRAMGIDVVVMFNNGIEADDEWAYLTSTDSDNDTVSEGGFVAGSFLVEGSWDNTSATVPEPHLKRGGYVLDVHNARWYRVRDYIELVDVDAAGNNAVGTTTFQLQLETAIIQSSPAGSRAVFLPSVVDVYPLGTRSLPEGLQQTEFR